MKVPWARLKQGLDQPMPTGESYLIIAAKIIHKDGDLKAVSAYNQKRIVSNPIKAHFSRA